jgi:hypothetical protein
MDVKNVDHLAVGNLQVAADAATLLAARSGEIINLHLLDREAAQHHVAVRGAAEFAGFADAELKADSVRQILRLILFPASAAEAYHFLQRDHVGVKLAQYLGNPSRADHPIHAPAFVGVVGDDTKNWSVVLHERDPQPRAPASKVFDRM